MGNVRVVDRFYKKVYEDRYARRAWIRAGSPEETEPPFTALPLVTVEFEDAEGETQRRNFYTDQLDEFLAASGRDLED